MNRYSTLLPIATAALMAACSPTESDRGSDMAATALRLRDLAGSKSVKLVSGYGERVKLFLAGDTCYISDLYPVDNVSQNVMHRYRDLLSPDRGSIRLAKVTDIEECKKTRS